MHTTSAPPTTVTTHWQAPAGDLVKRWSRLCKQLGSGSPSRRLEWLAILRDGLGHRPVLLEARAGDETLGMLPLAHMQSALFGKFLVALPYLNVGGPLATHQNVARELIARAVELADELDVKHLELRNELRLVHPAFNHELTEKVHMRLNLPAAADKLWSRLGPKVRNQIRKAEKEGLSYSWGQWELLAEFYDVFSRNMRNLGTPVFSRRLFAGIVTHLADSAEFCVVRGRGRVLAAALVVHGAGVSEVPSASSLRQFKHLNANMLLYWQLLSRAIEHGQQTFDFGRSSEGSNTHRFKAQWGAAPIQPCGSITFAAAISGTCVRTVPRTSAVLPFGSGSPCG